jgi:hypothetical protein
MNHEQENRYEVNAFEWKPGKTFIRGGQSRFLLFAAALSCVADESAKPCGCVCETQNV